MFLNTFNEISLKFNLG